MKGKPREAHTPVLKPHLAPGASRSRVKAFKALGSALVLGAREGRCDLQERGLQQPPGAAPGPPR